MKCFIITFQIAEENNLGTVIQALKRYGTWANINKNTWAIVTDESASSIRDNLKKLISLNDRLFVVRSGTEAAWSNAIASSEWLKKNL